jgi:DNA-binding transcriptional MerR regulator
VAKIIRLPGSGVEMRIGELARRAGASVRSIRCYEQAGLIHANRARNGYRDFDDAAAERIRSIRDLLQTGFTVDEIRSLSSCLHGAPHDPDCHAMRTSLYREKLAKIDQQIATLALIRGRIEKLLERGKSRKKATGSPLTRSTTRALLRRAYNVPTETGN